MYRPSSSNLATSSIFLDAESTIRGLSQDYSTAFNTGNYDQAAALYASNGVCMAPHQKSAEGPKAVERVLRALGESGYHDLRFETQRVDLTTDTAVATGRYTVTVHLENGTSAMEAGKFLHVWRRLGAWLLLANCWNTDLPGLI